jgi:hypothetical protein
LRHRGRAPGTIQKTALAATFKMMWEAALSTVSVDEVCPSAPGGQDHDLQALAFPIGVAAERLLPTGPKAGGARHRRAEKRSGSAGMAGNLRSAVGGGSRTVVVPDLRGLGRLSRPAGGCDKKTETADIRAFVRALWHDRRSPVSHEPKCDAQRRNQRARGRGPCSGTIGAWRRAPCSRSH